MEGVSIKRGPLSAPMNSIVPKKLSEISHPSHVVRPVTIPEDIMKLG
jgi:hypothetical protein